MFETLFQYPAIVARHRRGPFAEARERFLNHCASQGLARTTLQRYAQELLVIAERIDITTGDAIGSSVIEAAASRWAREQRQRQLCAAGGGRTNSSFRRPRPGSTSWDVWKCHNRGSCPVRTALPILMLIGETSAVCTRPPSAIRAGM